MGKVADDFTDASVLDELRQQAKARSRARRLSSELRTAGFGDAVLRVPGDGSSFGVRLIERDLKGSTEAILGRYREQMEGHLLGEMSRALKAENRRLKDALGADLYKRLGVKVPRQVGLGGVSFDGKGVKGLTRQLSRYLVRERKKVILRASKDGPEALKAALLRGPGSVRAKMDRAALSLQVTLERAVRDHASSRFWRANQHLVRGVVFVATLDERTSTICQGHHGLVWTDVSLAARPPLHFHCRSVLSPILKSGFALGIRDGSASELDGKPPAVFEFGDWIDQKSDEERAEILKLRRQAGGIGSRSTG